MKKRLDRKFIPWVLAHTVEYWYYYIGAFICLYFLHSYQSDIPVLAKELGDRAKDGTLGEINVGQFFLLALAIMFFRTFSRLLFFYPARIQQKNLRLEIISRVETALPSSYQYKYSAGQLFQTIYNDLNRIRGFVGFALLQVGNIIIAASVFIPKISAFNADFLIAFSPLVVCIVLFTISMFFAQPLMLKETQLYGDLQNTLLESYDAKKTIQNFHSEKSLIKLFHEYSIAELKYFFKFSVLRSVSFPITKIGFAVSLLWGAYIVKSQGLPGSDLIFFSGFLFLVLEPLMLISWIGVVAAQGYASWKRIKWLLADLKDNDETHVNTDSDLYMPEVLLWDKKVNIEIKSNEWNVLVGDTGCGKSYFLENYAEFLYKKGAKYSFIQQEPYLYNDTIYNNIVLGDDSSEKREIVKDYIKMFGLDELAETVEAVMDLEVGENGKKVSGGQAKRVALIRSLVADVDFILWDDPFSSVDLILEQIIAKQLKNKNELKSKTFIITSHRVSTVRSCQWIIYLDKDVSKVEMGEREHLFNKKESEISEYFNKQLV